MLFIINPSSPLASLAHILVGAKLLSQSTSFDLAASLYPVERFRTLINSWLNQFKLRSTSTLFLVLVHLSSLP